MQGPSRLYDGEIAFVDQQLGPLARGAASSAGDALVVGDHGEMLGEHGETSHGLLPLAGFVGCTLLALWLWQRQGQSSTGVGEVEAVQYPATAGRVYLSGAQALTRLPNDAAPA